MATSPEEFLAETRARDKEMGVTPYFMEIAVENIPQSYLQKKAVYKNVEVVQIRFPGDTRYSPVFKTDSMWFRNGNEVITYAERFADQYQKFLSGEDQEASGTPLEALNAYGMTPELKSFCRSMKIYSVEAIKNLEGQGLKNLGMRGNRLKEMARAYYAEFANSEATLGELEKLRARIAELEAEKVPAQEFDGYEPEQVEEFANMSDDELKEAIAEITGTKPRGQPSRERLIRDLKELKEAS